MAMLSVVAPSAISAAGVLSQCVLPASIYAAKLFSRSSSYLTLTAPHLAKEEDAAVKSGSNHSRSTNEWGLTPAMRELTRAAGGFDGERRWPLGHPLTLLDHQLMQATPSPSSCFARHYSIMPRQPLSLQTVAAAPAAQQHTAAIQLPEAVTQEPSRLGIMAAWLSKTTPRMKGYGRKLALRQVNRKIVARVARRLTIGIPVLGFYFVSKLMVKDFARVKTELAAGEYSVAALFSTALAADVLDLAAQITVITGLAHANLGMGLASAAALLAAADKASMATAALSFSCGLSGELMSLQHQASQKGGEKSE